MNARTVELNILRLRVPKISVYLKYYNKSTIIIMQLQNVINVRCYLTDRMF